MEDIENELKEIEEQIKLSNEPEEEQEEIKPKPKSKKIGQSRERMKE